MGNVRGNLGVGQNGAREGGAEGGVSAKGAGKGWGRAQVQKVGRTWEGGAAKLA